MRFEPDFNAWFTIAAGPSPLPPVEDGDAIEVERPVSRGGLVSLGPHRLLAGYYFSADLITPDEGGPPACCDQQTLTVPPEVTAKTAQKHDHPSAAHRRSDARRTGAERGFATAKDPASNDISRGRCRLMGLAPLMLFAAALLVARNQRIIAALNARQAENARRAAAGLPRRSGDGAARHSPASPRRHNARPAAHANPGTCDQHDHDQAGSASTPATRITRQKATRQAHTAPRAASPGARPQPYPECQTQT